MNKQSVLLIIAVALCPQVSKLSGHENHEGSKSEPQTVIASAPSDAKSSAPPVHTAVANAGKQAADCNRLGNSLMQASRESMNPGDCEQAEVAFRKALTLEPRNAEALIGLAWVHNTEHDFDAGQRFARAALEIDKALPDAWSLLGDAAVELGDYDRAFEDYQKALDLRPDLGTYSRSAQLLWFTGDVAKARWLLGKAINAGGAHAENGAWCRAQLALMLLNDGALLPAEQNAAQAVKQAPDNPLVLNAAGRVQTALDNYPKAIELYTASLAKRPTHDALAALVDLYEITDQEAEAEKLFAQVVAFHRLHGGEHGTQHHHHGEENASRPAEPHPHGNYQLAAFLTNHDRQLDEALAEARAAWRAYPNVVAADTLAWCLHKTGNHDEAAKMIPRALQWRTPNPEFHFHAGMIYSQIGEQTTARKHLNQALSLNPKFHPIHARLAATTLQLLAANAQVTEKAGEAAN